MIYDFHVHTNYSDGDFPPKEVVSFAKEANVDVMCFTDHDTMLSIDNAEYFDKKEPEIKIYGGIEISTEIYSINKHAHILSYRCDKNNKALNRLVRTTIERRTDSIYDSIDIINQRGETYIDKGEIEKYKGPNGFFKRHLFNYLVKSGYDDRSHKKSRKILNPNDGYAFVGFQYPECSRAIETVRQAGGIPILAHTFVNANFNAIDELIEAGLMGIEVYHPTHSKERIQLLENFCRKRNLLMTCGSDFHRFFETKHADIGKNSVDNEKTREFLSLLK